MKTMRDVSSPGDARSRVHRRCRGSSRRPVDWQDSWWRSPPWCARRSWEPTGRPGVMQQQLDALMERLYLAPIAGDVALRQALGVSLCCPKLASTETGAASSTPSVMPSASMSTRSARESGSSFAMDSVRRRGRFVEVIPPSLAERLSRRDPGGPDLKMAKLLVAVEPSTFAALPPTVFAIWLDPRWPARSNGSSARWFPDSESVIRNANGVENPGARGARRWLFAAFENGLGTLSSDELRERLAGDARRDIVETLAPLAHLRGDVRGRKPAVAAHWPKPRTSAGATMRRASSCACSVRGAPKCRLARRSEPCSCASTRARLRLSAAASSAERAVKV